jgi:dinuclear metal center YbgI/SA1388 family protein
MPERLSRHRLLSYLDRYLEAQTGSDYCPNGLQVEGRSEIGRIVTGVSACRKLFTRAAELDADAVLVHHGLYWRGDEQPLVGLLYQRVKLLVDAGINLLAYHLPLDRHPKVGNNAVAARRFGIESPKPFGDLEGLPVGFAGTLSTPLSPTDFSARCHHVFGQEPLSFDSGPDPIRSAAFVSGAAERLFHTAIAEGYDAYVTGEVSEWVMNVAGESKTHFFAAGHYATERLGVQALGAHLTAELGLEVEFVDVPNPV